MHGMQVAGDDGGKTALKIKKAKYKIGEKECDGVVGN